MSNTTVTMQKEEIEEKKKQFFWTYTEEPHRTRREAIIAAHPEVPSHTAFIPHHHILTLSRSSNYADLTRGLQYFCSRLEVFKSLALPSSAILQYSLGVSY